MSDPKDQDDGREGQGDELVVQPLTTHGGVEAPVVRDATAADEAALPVVEVTPVATVVEFHPAEHAPETETEATPAAPESTPAAAAPTAAGESGPTAPAGADRAAGAAAAAGRPRDAGERKGGRRKKRRDAAGGAPVGGASGERREAPAGPAAAHVQRPAPTESPLERSGVIEMKSPDSPEFSLLERSVLIAAPADGSVGADEDPYAGLSRGQRAMRWLSPRLLGLVLLLFGGAGVAGTFVTLLHPFRDWFMHLLMYSVILAFYLLYLKAHARRAPVWRYLMMLVTVALSAFFAWILMGYVPAQKVWYVRSVLWREEMTLLWVPIGLLAAAAVLLLFHCVFVARHAARPRPTA